MSSPELRSINPLITSFTYLSNHLRKPQKIALFPLREEELEAQTSGFSRRPSPPATGLLTSHMEPCFCPQALRGMQVIWGGNYPKARLAFPFTALELTRQIIPFLLHTTSLFDISSLQPER